MAEHLITESSSHYQNLESMSTKMLLQNINNEDKKVALAVEAVIPVIEKVVDVIVEKLRAGGRLFYIGAGTSGRLGIVDASEIPPTYGMPHGKVIGIIAGGDVAIRKAVENAEDDKAQAWKDLSAHQINENDFLIGIAASGKTPYVIGGV
nr:N-acetylmuramic acid 6-phosphate etherase [Cyclobacteriaceae bacterium]